MDKINTEWTKAAGVRAIKTFAQTVVALVGTNAVGVTDIDWPRVASVAVLAGVMSIFTSLAGLPEISSRAE